MVHFENGLKGRGFHGPTRLERAVGWCTAFLGVNGTGRSTTLGRAGRICPSSAFDTPGIWFIYGTRGLLSDTTKVLHLGTQLHVGFGWTVGCVDEKHRAHTSVWQSSVEPTMRPSRASPAPAEGQGARRFRGGARSLLLLEVILIFHASPQPVYHWKFEE